MTRYTNLGFKRTHVEATQWDGDAPKDQATGAADAGPAPTEDGEPKKKKSWTEASSSVWWTWLTIVVSFGGRDSRSARPKLLCREMARRHRLAPVPRRCGRGWRRDAASAGALRRQRDRGGGRDGPVQPSRVVCGPKTRLSLPT